MSTVTAPESDAHIAVNPAINSAVDPAPIAPKTVSSTPTQQPSMLAAKSSSDDLGPVIVPLVALASPQFTAAEILTPPPHCQPSAVVLSSPHAGRVYPANLLPPALPM